MAYIKSGIPPNSDGLRRSRADIYSQDDNLTAIVPGASSNTFSNGPSLNYNRGFRSVRRRFPANLRRAPFCYVYGSSQRMVTIPPPFYFAPVGAIRRRMNAALDRYPPFNTRNYAFSQFAPIVNHNLQGDWRRRQPGGENGFRRRRNPRFPRRKSFAQGGFRDAPVVSNRGRRGRYTKKVTADSLNADLDAYMGTETAVQRLDNQLDAYFGRQGTSALDQNNLGTPDALNDPSDIAMDGRTSSCSAHKSIANRVRSL